MLSDALMAAIRSSNLSEDEKKALSDHAEGAGFTAEEEAAFIASLVSDPTAMKRLSSLLTAAVTATSSGDQADRLRVVKEAAAVLAELDEKGGEA